MRYYFVSGRFNNSYTDVGIIDMCVGIEEFSTVHIREQLKKCIKEQGIPVDGVAIWSITPITEEEYYENEKHLNDKL